MIRATGPIVDELKRYDPNIRIRWSSERQKWAIEAKALRRDKLVPPVFHETVQWAGPKPVAWVERLFPVNSDKYIAYHDGYYTIGWTRNLDRRIIDMIVRRDSQKYASRNGFSRQVSEKIHNSYRNKTLRQKKRSEDWSYFGYDHLKFLNRTRPWANPCGGGV